MPGYLRLEGRSRGSVGCISIHGVMASWRRMGLGQNGFRTDLQSKIGVCYCQRLDAARWSIQG